MNFIFKYLVDCLLEVIYPSGIKCLGCGIEEDEKFLCLNCEERISYVNNSFYVNKDICYSTAYYNDIMKKLIGEFKYKKNFNVGEFFTNLLYEKIINEKIEFDYISFIPMNRDAIKKRGFNQCEYLANKLSDKTGKGVIDILAKKSGIKEQKTLSSSERKENIKEAFYIKNKSLNLNNKKILLIDDVITSGETLKNSVKIIKKYYNIDIFLLTVVKSSI